MTKLLALGTRMSSKAWNRNHSYSVDCTVRINTEMADGFTLVQRKKRGKRPTLTRNELQLLGPGSGGERQQNLEFAKPPEGRRRVCIAVQKKIVIAREELAVSDFYRSLRDSLKAATADSRPTNTGGMILSQINDSSTDSKPCFVEERVDRNASKKDCQTKQTERKNTELRTILHLEGCEENNCIRMERDEDAIKSRQIDDLRTKSTENGFSGDLGNEVIKVKGHTSNDVIDQSVQSVVCYGLGNFSDCAIARYQLALLMLVFDFLKISPNSCHMYDPRFTTEETQILTSLGLDVIQQNEEGKREVTEPTLFYMPHCGKPLYNNLLWANWRVDGLSKIVIIGNSFSNIQERLPSRTLEKDFNYLHQIMPHTREVPVTNNFRFADIFNDTSVHVFPLDRLQKIPQAFWDDRRDEPRYDPDAGAEIILHQ